MKQPELISSLQNPKVKQIVKWRDRPDRDRDQVVLIEGYRALNRALAGHYHVSEVFICPEMYQGEHEEELLERLQAQGAKIFQVTPAAFTKMAYRDRPEGLLGIGAQFHHTPDDLPVPTHTPFYLVAEQIEKPGNLGTIMRSADAVGVDGLLLCNSRTDLFNPNAVRASTGNLFTLPIAEGDSQSTLDWLHSRGVKVLAASPHAEQLYTELDLSCPLAIAVGSEQYGLTQTWMDGADLQVRLPMMGAADSLNVATCTAILLYEALRQRLLAGIVQDKGRVLENG